jgi:hypothetical protein
MRYLETAFVQLGFAIKLMQAAEDGLLDLASIDRPLTIADGPSVLVLPDRVLDSYDDLVLACQNNVTIAYGAAAITLNRCREEGGRMLPTTIVDECDQWIALVYQIRNAFAHDIAEPRWEITKERYARQYEVGYVKADLQHLNGVPFDYLHVGGPEGLFRLKSFGDDHAFGRAP